jgi:pimeloyl-ACP methyl ester carboxylesterase
MDQFRRDNLVFPVRDTGPSDGEPVVLLHGFPQDQSSYDQVVPHLHAAGMRTLVPLQRGYAPQARPAGRKPYRISECAADIAALLDAAELPDAHIVGHDWGGAVAWQLAQQFPARVRTLTVLSTPHPRALIGAMPRSTQALHSWYMAFFQLPWLPERLLPRSLVRSLTRTGLPEDAARRYTATLADRAALTGALNWYRAVPWSVSTRDSPEWTFPTSYVWGSGDPFLGRTAAERTARYVRGRYRFHELDAGHWLPETHPSEIAALIAGGVSPTP